MKYTNVIVEKKSGQFYTRRKELSVNIDAAKTFNNPVAAQKKAKGLNQSAQHRNYVVQHIQIERSIVSTITDASEVSTC